MKRRMGPRSPRTLRPWHFTLADRLNERARTNRRGVATFGPDRPNVSLWPQLLKFERHWSFRFRRRS
jgi:hypothetical protein